MGGHLQLKPDQGGSGGEVHHPMISGLRLGLGLGGLGGEHRVRVSIRVKDSKLGGELLHQRPARLQG